MSLISTQNFVAPFRSKFQIGSILVLAALVGMIRFASHSEHGSAVEVPRSGGHAKPAVEDDVTRFLEERALSKRRAPAANDEEIENLFDGEAQEAVSRRGAASPNKPPEEPKKLNDIKRYLDNG